MPPTRQQLIDDPTTSHALKTYLEASLDRDIVDVMCELEVALESVQCTWRLLSEPEDL